MKNTRLGALALFILCAPGLAVAQDRTWGCAFDKASGRTACYEVTPDLKQRTGRIIVSRPNIGLPGTVVSEYGETVRVYLGGNGTGYQDFRWQN